MRESIGWGIIGEDIELKVRKIKYRNYMIRYTFWLAHKQTIYFFIFLFTMILFAVAFYLFQMKAMSDEYTIDIEPSEELLRKIEERNRQPAEEDVIPDPTVVNEERIELQGDELEKFLKSDDPMAQALRTSRELQSATQ